MHPKRIDKTIETFLRRIMVSLLDLNQRKNASSVNNVIGKEDCDDQIDSCNHSEKIRICSMFWPISLPVLSIIIVNHALLFHIYDYFFYLLIVFV